MITLEDVYRSYEEKLSAQQEMWRALEDRFRCLVRYRKQSEVLEAIQRRIR